jgi:uncharacterized protein (DUF2267 family)
VDGAAALGAQLPLLVRGFYYEGWHPAGKPLKERKLEEFLAHVVAFPDDAVIDPGAVTKAVFQVDAQHGDAAEAEKVQKLFPAELRSLWP